MDQKPTQFYIRTSRKMRKSTMTGFGQYPDSVFKEQVRTFKTGQEDLFFVSRTLKISILKWWSRPGGQDSSTSAARAWLMCLTRSVSHWSRQITWPEYWPLISRGCHLLMILAIIVRCGVWWSLTRRRVSRWWPGWVSVTCDQSGISILTIDQSQVSMDNESSENWWDTVDLTKLILACNKISYPDL